MPPEWISLQRWKQEHLDENLKNIIAVRTDDADKPFAKDIVEVVKSPAYRAVIDDPKNIFTAFQKPEWMAVADKNNYQVEFTGRLRPAFCRLRFT